MSQLTELTELTAKLKEIFQINRADLDFGIYRILNTRSAEIERYLSETLPRAVKQAFGDNQSEQVSGWKSELEQAKKQAQELGIDPAQSPKVQELQNKIEQAKKGSANNETEVYRHLLIFFSRYYEDGDFISQRRYKGDTYAVPYAGEEVLLYWANKDQYYTKSGENFSNYRFTLADGRTVFFRLNSADIAKDNRKDNDAKRLFTLATAQTIERENEDGETEIIEIQPISQSEDGKTLTIVFDYKPFEKSAKQDKILEKDLQTLLAHDLLQTTWRALAERKPTEKNPNRTLLEKHLSDYTQKNTADYFIHKDLGGFLRRELDFYIKNEVMHLDDIQSAQAFAHIEANLRMIQTLRTIAHEIIDFLAQLENFQKKLWLKKKFVASCHYLITLNHIPERFYDAIFANPKQREQWQHLFAVKDLPSSDLILSDNSNPYAYLVVDTSLFDAEFQSELLTALSAEFSDSLDTHINGTLIHSDNFQALNILQARYREQVKCIYIDPPYNTGGDGFIYKDNYQHSSWISLINEIIKISKPFLLNSGAIFVSIDENEHHNLKLLLNQIFGNNNLLSDFVWISEGNFDNQAKVKIAHEYIVSYTLNEKLFPFPPVIDPSINENSKLFNDEIKNTIIKNGPKNPISKILLPSGFPSLLDEGIINKNSVTFPKYSDDLIIRNNKLINSVTAESGWSSKALCEQFIQNNMQPILDKKNQETIFVISDTGAIEAIKKRSTEQSYVISTIKGVGSVQSTKVMLDNMGFSYPHYPKPPKLIEYLSSMTGKEGVTFDYFAGSGTTAHAVINLNREDNGNRQYILVEQGEYFDTVLKPRVQKVIYSKEWKDGKPVPDKVSGSLNGVPQIVKVLKLESYEDTLNNLELRRSDLFDHLPENAQHDYLLHYMLNIESRDSLLNVSHFAKPFDYQLKIATNSAGAFDNKNIDLVETFNYLIGATVIGVDDKRSEQGFVAVECRLPNQHTDEKTLIFWRDCERIGYDELQQQFDRLGINPADSEYSQVYVNGDHTLETVWDGEQSGSLKIRSIEAEFLALMFAGDE